MLILLKNKHTLQVDDFFFQCTIGKNGITRNKIEGDKKTPQGIYNIEHLYYREDRIKKPNTNLKIVKIKKSMAWCDDIKDKKNYNKLINNQGKKTKENLFRKDRKYDLLIPIKYNFKKRKIGAGSCIFLHLTNDYKPTAGCIAINKKDFLIIIKLINRNTKIKIY